MTAILGYANLLTDLVEKDEAKEHLRTIRRNGDYLLEIINDILDLSKIEAGKFEVDVELFDPARLIEDVRSVMEVRASEGGLTLEVDYETLIPTQINSDPKRLKQILINLVGNAIKFTREGSVRIRVSYRQSSLRFEVIDTGIGMTQEQSDKLFKPFSQGDASVSRHFGGTGLGLAITRRLTDLLGGRVHAESEYGTGSRFTVTIPVEDVVDIVLAKPRMVIPSQFPTSTSVSQFINAHILVVDDRRDIRFLSKRLLTKAGATVVEAEDGLLAVSHIANLLTKRRGPCGNAKMKTDGRQSAMHECLPDLVLLDMQMPNLDGYQTARKLRELGYVGPIVALTADAMQGDMNLCIDAGCNDYLSKPIDADRLVEMVKHLTEAKRND